jgi:hypothetical protein
MRPWTDKIYGIPPEQVVGSSIKTKFVMRDGIPTIFRLPAVNFIDDKDGKPVGINGTSAAVRLLPLATPMAISKCCSGQR